MKLREIAGFFNELADFSLQESYDNSGIQLGDPGMEIRGAVICIDVTEAVLQETIQCGYNLVISHHPLIFGGLKSLTSRNSTERIIMETIRKDIAVLSVHTNLDAAAGGVNYRIADKMGLVNRKILEPVHGKLNKLVFFVPEDFADRVRNAIFDAGAGNIGNYDHCSFNSSGKGSFRAGEGASPFTGNIGEDHFENEIRVEAVFPEFRKNRILKALLESHPYEEVAYDIFPLLNSWDQAGMGIIGELEEEMEEYDFLNGIKKIFNAGCIRYTSLRNKKIKKVALCGGSGSFLLGKAISAGADVFVSGDFKYHQFFEAENRILIADIGHYESEQFTKELFYESLTKKFPKFALRLSEVNTNPINYL